MVQITWQPYLDFSCVSLVLMHTMGAHIIYFFSSDFKGKTFLLESNKHKDSIQEEALFSPVTQNSA